MTDDRCFLTPTDDASNNAPSPAPRFVESLRNELMIRAAGMLIAEGADGKERALFSDTFAPAG